MDLGAASDCRPMSFDTATPFEDTYVAAAASHGCGKQVKAIALSRCRGSPVIAPSEKLPVRSFCTKASKTSRTPQTPTTLRVTSPNFGVPRRNNAALHADDVPACAPARCCLELDTDAVAQFRDRLAGSRVTGVATIVVPMSNTIV